MTPSTDEGVTPNRRLREIWRRIESGSRSDHTSVVVPSLTFDREELAKIQGIQFYEERLLVSLLRLKDPRARVVYVTSLPVHPDVVSYYLSLLTETERRDAERRLTMLCAYDSSPRPLTEKILERPRLLDRIRRFVGGGDDAYLTCFNTTPLEMELARKLDIPLNGADPRLTWIGTKSGSRRAFEDASVPVGFGVVGIRSREDLVEGLLRLTAHDPAICKAVVKLDDSFAGAGNAVLAFNQPLPGDAEQRRRALDRAIDELSPATGEPVAAYLQKLERMSGIVEQFLEGVDGNPLRSPSVQLRIDPEGHVQILSTHEQVLEGAIGQTYVGCRFPADHVYRAAIQSEARKVGRVLADRGVVGRFAIDFMAGTDADDRVAGIYAVEINLRMGGTTFPFMALRWLVSGAFDEKTGEYVSSSGARKAYFATDNLRSPAYAGLAPEDFFEIIRRHGLVFDESTETGPVFHMIGALSQFGRIGVICIADGGHEAEAMYRNVVTVLDTECVVDGAPWTPPTHVLGLPISSME